MPRCDGPGPQINYRLAGNAEGHCLVLLRGLGRSSRHWPETLLQLLAEHFSLLLIDNRGVGASDRVAKPFSVPTMADDVARVLDHAQIARAHVFGMSLGGMVAQQFALRHAGRLDRLVLGCTMAGGAQARRVPLLGMLPTAAAKFQGARAALEAEAQLVLGKDFLQRNPQVVEGWLQLAREEPTSALTLALQSAAALRHDTSKQLERIVAPTLVITAEGDRLMPSENSRVLARRLPCAELFMLPGDAHDFATELPELCADVLGDFLLRPFIVRGERPR